MEEKQKVTINYKGSGVKTLKVCSISFFILAGILAATAFIVSTNRYSSGVEIVSFLGGAIFIFAFGLMLLGLSTIAKTALYKRTLLEEKYEFALPYYAKTIDKDNTSTGL